MPASASRVWADAVRSQPVAAVSRGGRGRRLDPAVPYCDLDFDPSRVVDDLRGAPPAALLVSGRAACPVEDRALLDVHPPGLGRVDDLDASEVFGCQAVPRGLKGRGVRPMGLVDVVRVRDQTHLVALELAVHDLRDGQPVDGRSGDRLGSCGSGQSRGRGPRSSPGVRPRPRPILPGRRAASCPLSPSCRAGGGDGPAPRRPGNAGGGEGASGGRDGEREQALGSG